MLLQISHNVRDDCVHVWRTVFCHYFPTMRVLKWAGRMKVRNNYIPTSVVMTFLHATISEIRNKKKSIPKLTKHKTCIDFLTIIKRSMTELARLFLSYSRSLCTERTYWSKVTFAAGMFTQRVPDGHFENMPQEI